MKLEKAHTDKIEEFLKAWNINFIEVRAEIIDHIASKIADDLKKDPSLDIENQVILYCNNLNEMGFVELKNSMKRSFDKKALKQLLYQFTQHLWGKKALITLLTVVILFLSQNFLYTGSKEVFYSEFPALATLLTGLTIWITAIYHNSIKLNNSLLVRRTTYILGFGIYFLWPSLRGSISGIFHSTPEIIGLAYYGILTLIIIISSSIISVILWSNDLTKSNYSLKHETHTSNY